jgi:diguanylate cyclase
MLKILVIEDDAKIRKNIARLLSLEGYEVMVAENGAVGLEMALLEKPSIILCDILMPEMNGYEVLECLRKKAPDYFAPFIFVSAKGSKDDVRQGMILGADDYLTKPFTRLELLDAITSRLAKQKAFEQHYQEQIAKIETDSEDKKKYDPITGLPNLLYLQDCFNVLINEFESMRFNHPEACSVAFFCAQA